MKRIRGRRRTSGLRNGPRPRNVRSAAVKNFGSLPSRCIRNDDDEGVARVAHTRTYVSTNGGEKTRVEPLSPALRTHGGFLPPPNGDRLLILCYGRADLVGPAAWERVRNATANLDRHSRSASFIRAPCYRDVLLRDYASRCGVSRGRNGTAESEVAAREARARRFRSSPLQKRFARVS